MSIPPVCVGGCHYCSSTHGDGNQERMRSLGNCQSSPNQPEVKGQRSKSRTKGLLKEMNITMVTWGASGFLVRIVSAAFL